MGRQKVWRVTKLVGTALTVLALAASVLMMIADNFFVTHAVAKAQHEALRGETKSQSEMIEQKEELHYHEVSRRLDEIGNRVERIYNVVVQEKKQ